VSRSWVRDGFGRLSYEIEDAAQRQQIRDFVSGYLSNTLGRVVISDEVEFTITRKADHVAIDWDGKIEASLPVLILICCGRGCTLITRMWT
jgi:hypothetical protein